MRNVAWTVVALSFVIVSAMSFDAVAQPANLPKAPMPLSDTFGGVASTIDGFAGALHDLIGPGRQPPKPQRNQPAQPQPRPQSDPVKACNDWLTYLQASINAYFQSLWNNYQEQIKALNGVRDFNERQRRRMSLETWWRDAQAIQRQLYSQISAKRRSCSDTLEHPSSAWTMEEGDRINAWDTTGLAMAVSYVIWNPPNMKPYRPDELLILIKEPRILP